MKLCLRCNQYFADGISVCPRDNSALESVGKDPLIGALINDRYVVDSVIGKGSSGIVYKATRLMMGREVAVKVLHSFLGADSGSLDRVLREFAAASKLRHPHIITLWEHGITDDQQPYLVMDYLEGGTLADLIKEREFLQPTRALPIVEQVCDALTEAHSHGIVHRDIKPENVVLEEMGDGDDYVNDYVKVLDFGIADVPEAKSVQVGRPKTVAGSPAYMSPEQCQGLPLDQRSDIYSMAVMVFEMLTGERPFKHEEHRALMLAHVTEPPIKLSEARVELTFPEELEQVFAKALAKKPDARYQEIRDFWLSLKDACKTYKSSPQPVRVANKKVDSVKVDAFEFSPMERLTDGTENAGQLIPWGDDIKSPEMPPPMPSTAPFGGHANEAARALAAESEGDLWALEPNRNNAPMAPEAWLKSATAEPETEESSFESGWGADPSSKSPSPPPPPPGYSPLPAVPPNKQAPSPGPGQGMVQTQNKSSQSSAQTAFTGSQSKPNGPGQQSGMNTAAGLSGQHSKPLVQPPSKGGPAVPIAKNPPPNGAPGAAQSSSQPVQQNRQVAQNQSAPAAPPQNAAPRNVPSQNAPGQSVPPQNAPQKPVQNTNAPIAQNQQPNQGAPLPPNGVTSGAGASGARPQQGHPPGAPQSSPQQIAPNGPNPARPITGAGVSGPQPQRIGGPGISQPVGASGGAPQAQKIGGPQAQKIQPTPPSAPPPQSDDSGIRVSTGKTQQQQRNIEEASAQPAAQAPAAPPLPTPSPEDLERERAGLEAESSANELSDALSRINSALSLNFDDSEDDEIEEKTEEISKSDDSASESDFDSEAETETPYIPILNAKDTQAGMTAAYSHNFPPKAEDAGKFVPPPKVADSASAAVLEVDQKSDHSDLSAAAFSKSIEIETGFNNDDFSFNADNSKVTSRASKSAFDLPKMEAIDAATKSKQSKANDEQSKSSQSGLPSQEDTLAARLFQAGMGAAKSDFVKIPPSSSQTNLTPINVDEAPLTESAPVSSTSKSEAGKSQSGLKAFMEGKSNELAAEKKASEQKAIEEKAALAKAAEEKAEAEKAAIAKAKADEAKALADAKAAEEMAARELAAKEKADRERAEKERLEKERVEKERAEKERVEKERAEKERAEKERVEKAKVAEEARIAAEEAAKAKAEEEKIAAELKAAAQAKEAEAKAAEARAAEEKAAREREEASRAAEAEARAIEEARLADEKAAKAKFEEEKERVAKQKIADEKASQVSEGIAARMAQAVGQGSKKDDLDIKSDASAAKLSQTEPAEPNQTMDTGDTPPEAKKSSTGLGSLLSSKLADVKAPDKAPDQDTDKKSPLNDARKSLTSIPASASQSRTNLPAASANNLPASAAANFAAALSGSGSPKASATNLPPAKPSDKAKTSGYFSAIQSRTNMPPAQSPTDSRSEPPKKSRTGMEPAVPPAPLSPAASSQGMKSAGAADRLAAAKAMASGSQNAMASSADDGGEKMTSAVERLMEAAKRKEQESQASGGFSQAGMGMSGGLPSGAAASSSEIGSAASRLAAASGDANDALTSDLMNRFLEAANRGSELKKKASDANAAKSEAINREFSQPSIPAGAENAPPIDVAEQTQERLRLAMESVSAKPVSKPAARQPDVTNMRPSDLQLHNLAIARAGQDIELNLDNASGKKNSQTRTRMRSAFKNQGVDARLIVVVVALVAAVAGYWFILKPTLDKPAATKVVEKNPAQQVFAQGKYAKAIEILEKKDATDALTEQETDMLHNAHYKQAEVLVKQKHFTEAKKLLKKIPDDSPHSAKAKALTKKYRALRR